MKKKEDTSSLHEHQDTKPDPMTNKEDVSRNPDEHIDQDFPGYPHHPSKEKHIDPKSENDKLTSGAIKKTDQPEKRQNSSQSEIESDGSANAFEQTELRSEENKYDRKEEGGY
ncbi:MAG: hypothetical protein H7Y31_01560 [Chitinophagaceae bacterium]|nr:hypothetical protein [Chitinophagaceae bacterium]